MRACPVILSMAFDSWAENELSKLGYSETNELITYLNTLEDDDTVEECLSIFLDLNIPDHQSLKDKLFKKYKEYRSTHLPSGFYRKNNGNNIDIQVKNCEKTNLKSQTKKKSKFVSLYSDEALRKDVIILPGRHKCECQASKHRLINNCLKCGRVVCEQEGSGPCVFCQNLVLSKEEKEIINKGSKKSASLHNKLLNSKKVIDLEAEKNSFPPSLLKAIEHKNRLLEFDKTSEKRTKVYDDESDYFHSNSKWVNPENREKLRKYEEEMIQNKYDRHNKKYTIDLLGRKVTDFSQANMPDLYDPKLLELLQENNQSVQNKENVNNFKVLDLSRPLYIDDLNKNTNKLKSRFSADIGKIQDREIQEMRDDGMCLSMHQPWASLLVAGIKIHEGRNWYHSHRGRLWIASAAKAPTQTEITSIEESYRKIIKKEKVKFPVNYPTSCLLGCVDVVDILPQEEYRKKYPNGESECPYVFICENPLEMSMKFPIRGQHKIYKLDSKIHQTALKSLKLT